MPPGCFAEYNVDDVLETQVLLTVTGLIHRSLFHRSAGTLCTDQPLALSKGDHLRLAI